MADLKVTALEAQVLHDPGPTDLKVTALEAQVAYAASRVDIAGAEVLSGLTTPSVAEYGGLEVMVALTRKQRPRVISLTLQETRVRTPDMILIISDTALPVPPIEV